MGDEVRHIKVSASEKRGERAAGFVAVGVHTALIVALWVFKARKQDPRDTQLLTPPAPTASAGPLADVSVTSTAALSPARIAEIWRRSPRGPRRRACAWPGCTGPSTWRLSSRPTET